MKKGGCEKITASLFQWLVGSGEWLGKDFLHAEQGSHPPLSDLGTDAPDGSSLRISPTIHLAT